MVKNSDTGQQEMVTTNKLTRLKQTLTTGFQQAQDSGKIKWCALYYWYNLRFLNEYWKWRIVGILVVSQCRPCPNHLRKYGNKRIPGTHLSLLPCLRRELIIFQRFGQVKIHGKSLQSKRLSIFRNRTKF